MKHEVLLCLLDPRMRAEVAARLESVGIAVTHAATACALVEQALRDSPETVVMDLAVSDLPPETAIRILRGQRPWIRRIVVGTESKPAHAAVLEHGVYYYDASGDPERIALAVEASVHRPEGEAAAPDPAPASPRNAELYQWRVVGEGLAGRLHALAEGLASVVGRRLPSAESLEGLASSLYQTSVTFLQCTEPCLPGACEPLRLSDSDLVPLPWRSGRETPAESVGGPSPAVYRCVMALEVPLEAFIDRWQWALLRTLSLRLPERPCRDLGPAIRAELERFLGRYLFRAPTRGRTASSPYGLPARGTVDGIEIG